MKNNNFTLINLITIIIFAVCLCGLIIISGTKIFSHNQAVTNAITTGGQEYDEFDKWLTEELELKAIPAHIFIKKDKVVNVVDYYVDEKEFKKELKEKPLSIDLYDKPLYDVNGNKINLSDYDVIYVKKANCKYCADQNKIEPTIHEKNKQLNFLTYYIKTEKSELENCKECE